MIEVRVERDAAGALARLSSVGHASAAQSAACVAVSTLLKSSARAYATRPSIALNGSAPHPGMMQIELGTPQERDREYVCGVTELLMQGLRELAAEFPDEIVLSESVAANHR